VAFAACGVSEETSLKAVGQIHRATLKTYGWSPHNPAQHVEVALANCTMLNAVFDMSLFGPLVPGSTHADAERAMGKPARTWKDEWGETWYVYELPNGVVEVGCQYYTSGGTPSACSWTLHARPKGEPMSRFLDPQLAEYVRLALAARPRVYSRSVGITTGDGQQTVQVFLESRVGPGVYWTDRRRAATRRGEPRCRPTNASS
jgi:hypothetical protein